MLRLATLVAGLVIIGTITADAHSNEARIEEQAAEIEAGRRNGTITWREGRELRKEQTAIAEAKETLEADGHLSRADKHVLFKMQDEAEEHIREEETDSWRRPWWLPRFGR